MLVVQWNPESKTSSSCIKVLFFLFFTAEQLDRWGWYKMLSILTTHTGPACVCVDLYKQHIKGSSECVSSPGGRALEGGRGGIVHSQRHSVSGCKLLQLDSTPTLASYITSDIPCLHVQSVHQLIVCDNHQQWQNCEQISSLIKQPSLQYVVRGTVFSLPLPRRPLSFSGSLSLCLPNSLILSPPKTQRYEAGSGLIVKSRGIQSTRGGGSQLWGFSGKVSAQKRTRCSRLHAGGSELTRQRSRGWGGSFDLAADVWLCSFGCCCATIRS